MHTLGYLGNRLNPLANGNDLYRPEAVVNVASILLAQPAHSVGSMVLYDVLKEYVAESHTPQDIIPPLIEPSLVIPLDGFWGVTISLRGYSGTTIQETLSSPEEANIDIFASSNNPLQEEIAGIWESLKVTPASVTHRTHQGMTLVLNNAEAWGTWLDLSIAITAATFQEDIQSQKFANNT